MNNKSLKIIWLFFIITLLIIIIAFADFIRANGYVLNLKSPLNESELSFTVSATTIFISILTPFFSVAGYLFILKNIIDQNNNNQQTQWIAEFTELLERFEKYTPDNLNFLMVDNGVCEKSKVIGFHLWCYESNKKKNQKIYPYKLNLEEIKTEIPTHEFELNIMKDLEKTTNKSTYAMYGQITPLFRVIKYFSLMINHFNKKSFPKENDLYLIKFASQLSKQSYIYLKRSLKINKKIDNDITNFIDLYSEKPTYEEEV